MTQASIAGRRVLIVEDEALVVMMLEEMLRELGCVVTGTASQTDAAKEMLATSPCDCALLDIKLGSEPVYPLAELLAARDVPFIFVTGYDHPDVLPAFRNRPVLRKPFDLASLQQALVNALALAGRPGAAPRR